MHRIEFILDEIDIERESEGLTMRYGDYVIMLNLFLNLCALSAYAYQGHYKQAIYWVGVGIINGSLLTWR